MLICQLTDLHIRPLGQAAYRVVETNMLAERACRAVLARRPQPGVVLITGDLTDCGLDAEYDLLLGILQRLPQPPYVIPGNHDRRDACRRLLAHLPGVASDPRFIQYAIEEHPVRIVMLDSVVPGATHGFLCAERLAFLDRTLAARPEQPTMVALHHPPFATGIAHLDAINLVNASEFASVIARHRHVERIISGHHHRPIVSRVAHAIATVSPAIGHQLDLDLRPGQPGAIVLEPSAYQLHAWSPNIGFVTHTALVEDWPGPFPFLGDADYPGN